MSNLGARSASIVVRCASKLERAGCDCLGRDQAAGAHIAAGKQPAVRTDQVHAIATQDLQLALRRGVLVHAHVHGGSHQHRPRETQIGRGEDILGEAGSEA